MSSSPKTRERGSRKKGQPKVDNPTPSTPLTEDFEEEGSAAVPSGSGLTILNSTAGQGGVGEANTDLMSVTDAASHAAIQQSIAALSSAMINNPAHAAMLYLHVQKALLMAAAPAMCSVTEDAIEEAASLNSSVSSFPIFQF